VFVFKKKNKNLYITCNSEPRFWPLYLSAKTYSIFDLHRTHSVLNPYLHTPTHTEDRRIFVVGRTSGGDLVQPTAQSRVSSDVRSGCSGLYPVSFETPKDGDYTTSLGNCSLRDCPYGEKAFAYFPSESLISVYTQYLSLPYQHNAWNSLAASSEQNPPRYWKATNRSPQSHLFSRLNKPRPLSPSQGNWSRSLTTSVTSAELTPVHQYLSLPWGPKPDAIF